MWLSTISVALLASVAVLATRTSPSQSDQNQPAKRRVTPAQQNDTFEYWTSERMRNARPMPLLHGGENPEAPEFLDVVKGDEPGAIWTGEGLVTRVVGRAFFTVESTGRDGWCSATAVESKNGNTVVTAGHCVFLNTQWHTNWMFVPGLKPNADGGFEMPYGQWAATDLICDPWWSEFNDDGEGSSRRNWYDTAAVVVRSNNGKRLADVTGASRIAFDVGLCDMPDSYAFGYPSDWPPANKDKAPENQDLIYSSGEPLVAQQLAIGCRYMVSKLYSGASGGPWFKDFDVESGSGVLYSVNSASTGGNGVLSPRFGWSVRFESVFGMAELISPESDLEETPLSQQGQVVIPDTESRLKVGL